MSDYLQNIVLRSFGLAEVVQPRVPQLFEQAPASGSSPESSTPTEIAPTTAPRDPIAEMQQSETTPREVRHDAPVPEATATQITDGNLPFTIRRNGPPPMVREELSPASLIPTVRARDSASLAHSTTTHPAEPKSQPERSEVSPGPLSREPSVASIEQTQPALSSTRLQTSIPKRSLPSLARNLPAEPQPAPIKITIGRVDVRAIMPSGPPRTVASARPKPALSLESYLKQREEGKR